MGKYVCLAERRVRAGWGRLKPASTKPVPKADVLRDVTVCVASRTQDNSVCNLH